MMINQTFEAISTVHGPFGQQMQISENDVFLFDIDAVSNAHQREMNHAFASYLSDFARHRACYLLTSCNYAETATRIPSRVRRELAGIFSSAGTELWHRNELLVRHEHSFSDDIYECIVKLLLQSSYPAKQTPLIDCGPATLRICLAGTRAGLAAKRAYLEWEREHGELEKIVEALESRFPDHTVYRDTGVSLLVTPRSYSTALVQTQILKRHKSARLVAYLCETAADGFAAPLCDAFQEGDIVAKVGGASDVSQLLSYENRRIQEKNERIWNPLRLVQGA